MTAEELISRLQRELEVVVSLQESSRKTSDRLNRLGLREVASFESGYEAAFEYTRSFLTSLIVDYSASGLSDDG